MESVSLAANLCGSRMSDEVEEQEQVGVTVPGRKRLYVTALVSCDEA